MKRFAYSDSLGALISICPPKEEKSPKSKQGYSREFQAMLDSLVEEDLDCLEEASSHTTEKKRRLRLDQVKALEKNFEVENKLEPERKLQLAQEVGLQPRQVAIWFQNRRARWKTKQLEKDYGLLKANYDALKLDYDNLEQENDALTAKLKELKAKLKAEHSENSECPILSEESKEHEVCNYNGIVNEDAQKLMISTSSSSSLHLNNGPSSTSHSLMERLQLSNSRMVLGNACYQTQIVKMEEQSLFTAEESCNFFSVDQAPTLQWYFTGQ